MKTKLPFNCAIKLPTPAPISLRECGDIIGGICAKSPLMPGWEREIISLNAEFSGYLAFALSEQDGNGVLKWCGDWCAEAASLVVDPATKLTALGTNPLFAYFEFSYRAATIVVHRQCSASGTPPLVTALQHVTHRMVVSAVAGYCASNRIQFPAFRLSVRNLGRDVAALPPTKAAFGVAPGLNLAPSGTSIDHK